MQFGAQLGVGVGDLVGWRVGVGVPAALFLKMTSVTPAPTLTMTPPREVFL